MTTRGLRRRVFCLPWGHNERLESFRPNSQVLYAACVM